MAMINNSQPLRGIYNNCKKLNIPPDIIPSWIKDLLDFNSFISTSLYPNNKRNLIEIDQNKTILIIKDNHHLKR